MAKARKEIDKDSMYQKIMPSSMRATPPEERVVEQKKPAPARPRKSPTAVTISSRPHAPAPVTRMLEEQPEQASVTGRAAGPVRPHLQEPSSKAALVNIMERLIAVKIDLAMDKFHCCPCEVCRQEITAFALNKLTPRYITDEPELIEEAMANKEANTQVTTALVQAILKIKANPKH